MAFGISKDDLRLWKSSIDEGNIAFITHFWLDDRFPDMKTVTKVGCKDLDMLAAWGADYGLKREWIHIRKDGYSHFDLLGERQLHILKKEGKLDQLSLLAKMK
ncbi:YneQ [Bacillus freudenreichii]|nr:YneQ [Bacillus freudenreichii]